MNWEPLSAIKNRGQGRLIIEVAEWLGCSVQRAGQLFDKHGPLIGEWGMPRAYRRGLADA